MLLSGVPELDCLVPGAGGRQTHLGTMLHTSDCIIMTTEAGGLLCGEVSVEESSVQSSAEGVPHIGKAAVQHCILHTQHISTVSSSLIVCMYMIVCTCVYMHDCMYVCFTVHPTEGEKILPSLQTACTEMQT